MTNKLPSYDDIKYTYATAIYEEWYPGMNRNDDEENLRAEQFDTVINNIVAERALTLPAEQARALLTEKSESNTKIDSLLLDAWAEAIVTNPPLAELLWQEIDKL